MEFVAITTTPHQFFIFIREHLREREMLQYVDMKWKLNKRDKDVRYHAGLVILETNNWDTFDAIGDIWGQAIEFFARRNFRYGVIE